MYKQFVREEIANRKEQRDQFGSLLTFGLSDNRATNGGTSFCTVLLPVGCLPYVGQ
jgi:hypothetical protein